MHAMNIFLELKYWIIIGVLQYEVLAIPGILN
jgi:hypothetical protein